MSLFSNPKLGFISFSNYKQDPWRIAPPKSEEPSPHVIVFYCA